VGQFERAEEQRRENQMQHPLEPLLLRLLREYRCDGCCGGGGGGGSVGGGRPEPLGGFWVGLNEVGARRQVGVRAPTYTLVKCNFGTKCMPVPRFTPTAALLHLKQHCPGPEIVTMIVCLRKMPMGKPGGSARFAWKFFVP
jgi:hypothetical protein